MTVLLTALNTIVLFAVLIGRPAPTSLGIVEVLIGACAAAALFASVWLFLSRANWPLQPYQRIALLCLCLFVLPILISVVVGAVQGVRWEAMFRAVTPYLALVGVGFAAPASSERYVRHLVVLLVIVGVLHGLYLLTLFFGVLSLGADATSIRFARITLLDPRTTMPLVLAGVVLPWTFFARVSGWGTRVLMVAAVGIASLGAAATLTRSMILAVLVSMVSIVFILWVRQAVRHAPLRVAIRKGVAVVSLLMIVAAGTVVVTPPLRSLAGAVLVRAQTAGDTGRVDDEWIPAIGMLGGGGVPAALTGIGAGQTFVTAGGEERTYVHNLVIYALLYSGIPGATMWLLGYLILTVELLRRGWREDRPELLGGAVMVVAIFIYGQFFAVHKLLSYNLMLFFAIQMLFAKRERAT